MSTKKTTTANKTVVKQYLVIDSDGDIVAYGNMDEIIESLNEYNTEYDEEYDEISFDEWISQCTIHELGNGKKMKYTPAKFEIK